MHQNNFNKISIKNNLANDNMFKIYQTLRHN